MGVATGCGFKEIYRFPHTTYPYSSCICTFLQQHPYFFFHFVKIIIIIEDHSRICDTCNLSAQTDVTNNYVTCASAATGNWILVQFYIDLLLVEPYCYNIYGGTEWDCPI